jgi:hypothetical protein
MADMFDKEELSTVAGLFSNTLAVAEAERQAQQEAAFKRYSGGGAGQNPLALLSGLAGMFGTAAGQELRGAGGFESPTVQLASVREQARKQFDTNTPQGLIQYAQFLNQNGDAAGARQAIMLAQAQVQRGATLGKTQEEVRLMGREIKEIGVPNNPELIQRAVVDKDGNIIARVGEPYSRFSQKTSIDARNVMDTRGKAFEAADTETLKKVRTEAGAASGQLSLIAQARENLPSAVVGQGLPALIRGLNTQLAPLGINTEQVAGTRNLEQALKSIIAQGIKQYGANPSTVDLQFAVSAAADIKDPLQAISATLNYLEKRAKLSVNKADAAEQYLLKNQNLAGFEKQWTEQSLRSMLPKPPEQAITLLLSNPALATQFDAKYGEGASKQYLGKK